MTLKLRLWIYLGVVHAAVAAVLIWQRGVLGWWLFPLELLLVTSLAIGLKWVHVAQKPLEIAQTLTDVIESGEFGSRYPRVGYKELDRVVEAYERMLTHLQREWLRLGEKRGFFERFLEVTSVGIVIFDFDDNVSLVNPRARELLGAPAGAELKGRPLAAIDSPLAQRLATLGVDDTQMITDGAGRRLRCQRAQFTDRGFMRSYLLIEELTAELNRSERATYEKLIRLMSHEVTNTVAATNSLLESCRNYADEFRNDDHRCDYENALSVVVARNRNLNEFTKGFSDLVKLPEPQLEEVDVRQLLAAMQTIFSAEIKQRNIGLEVYAPDGLPVVSMDRNQMDQALMNVIKNAVEAIDRDGTIEIVARWQAGHVELAVIDSGVGLDEESRRNLFTPFYTSKSQGQGLGLTLVKEILTQHGFAFSLETADGRTRFEIRMPVRTRCTQALRAR